MRMLRFSDKNQSQSDFFGSDFLNKWNVWRSRLLYYLILITFPTDFLTIPQPNFDNTCWTEKLKISIEFFIASIKNKIQCENVPVLLEKILALYILAWVEKKFFESHLG